MTKTSYEIHVVNKSNEQFYMKKYDSLGEATEAKELLENNNRKYNLYQYSLYRRYRKRFS